MSDFVLTIDSDDEQQSPQIGTSANAGRTVQERKDLQDKKNGKGKGKAGKKGSEVASTKGKGKAAAGAGDEQDGMDAGFEFDVLGGGDFSNSNGRHSTRRDPWDLDSSIDMFRKKNAMPRVTIDEIIARRRSAIKPDVLDDEPLTQEQVDLELEQHLEDGASDDEEEDTDAELDAELDDEQDDDEEQEEAHFDSEEELDGGDDGDEDQEQDGDEEDEDREADDDDASEASESFVSPFAKLANAKASLSDEEDEALNFATAADQEIIDTNYFESSNSELPHVTSNEASAGASLPPFSALPGATLSRPILLGLASLNLTTPTPVQAQAIPVALLGKDIVGSSITGSGKTVAFWVGVLERLLYRDKKDARTRVVVICPTRELAVQVHNVGQALARYTDIRYCLCVGGLSLKAQEAELKKRPDIVVSTPGRLIDHVRNTPSFSLDFLEILIIDEADRILEEGFRDELTEIISSCPHNRQTMLFSATITEDINTLARLSLQKPVRIAIDAQHTTSKNLQQEFVKVKQESAREAILVMICKKSNAFKERTIVFFRSKVQAHRMKIIFGLVGLRAEELHGDLSQEQRLESLKRFREGQVSFLLATDLASRGLDIKGISSVINYSMPVSFDIYLHRVGRTARAGKQGRALTLVTENDRKMVKQAIKSAALGGGSEQTTLETEEIKKVKDLLDGLRDEIEEIKREEKEEKEMRRTEMELTKGENMLQHSAEISARPARTWFQSASDKASSRAAGTAEYNAKMEDDPTAVSKKRAREQQPVLNHLQKRRKAAMDEGKTASARNDGNKGKAIASSIRSVKKSLRPGAITQFGDDKHIPQGLLSQQGSKKKDARRKQRKAGSFKEEGGGKGKGKPKSGPSGDVGGGKKKASSSLQKQKRR